MRRPQQGTGILLGRKIVPPFLNDRYDVTSNMGNVGTDFPEQIQMEFIGRSDYLRAKRRFVALLAAVLLAGCFRMGLPERIAPTISPAKHSQGTALVVFTPPDEQSLNAPSTIGYQFIFGAVPLTRIVLPSTAAEYFREAILSGLMHRFALAIETSAPETEQAQIEQCLPQMDTLRFQLRSLAVNGYDAIFFRILSVTMNYTLGNRALDLNETRFSLFASAPELEQLLYRSLSRQLKQFGLDRSHPRTGRCQKQVLFVRSPIVDSLSPESLSNWNRSFGFRTAPQFTRDSAARMLQKGIALNTQNDFFLLLAVLGDPQLPPQLHRNALELETLATFNEKPDGVSIRFRIRSLPGRQEIATSEDFGPIPIDPSASDGEFGRALQNVAQSAFAAFLAGRSESDVAPRRP